MKTLPRLTIFLLLAVLLAGCNLQAADQPISASVVEAMGGGDEAGFARAVAPLTFSFPRDHGPHPDYRTEWWYYTGNLSADDGTLYGYQLTFFRSALTPEMPARASDLATNQVYMAHFALTDGGRGEHESFERYSRGAGGLAGATGEPLFGVWLEDWRVDTVEPGVYHLVAAAEGADGPVALDLTLRETREPVFHGENGLHQKGPEAGNASYYYSLIQMESTGTVTSGGRTVDAGGLSWMDHEFSTSALTGNAVGWDWFSMQLDNGAALMVYEIRTADGGVLPYVNGTVVWPDGTQQAVSEEDFVLTPTGQWTSERTGITYPSGWTLVFPDLAIDLTVTPLIADQEMDVSFVYWEGSTQISGTMRGEAVQGRGYAELTGYGASSGEFQR